MGKIESYLADQEPWHIIGGVLCLEIVNLEKAEGELIRKSTFFSLLSVGHSNGFEEVGVSCLFKKTLNNVLILLWQFLTTAYNTKHLST